MGLDVRTVLRAGYPRLTRRHRLPEHHHRAIWSTLACKTASMGAHREVCPRGHVEAIRYNSCRHRSCPRCGRHGTEAWLDRQRDRLLPCEHFHVVFTIPSELRELWRWNRKAMADLLFGVANEVLVTLLGDPQHLGVRPGLVMGLHTWGRTLVFHPHVHCLVTGGGLTPEGHWKPCRNGFLLPIRVVRKLYRGLFLSRLEALIRGGRLALPTTSDLGDALHKLREAARKPWNVRIEKPYAHGAGLAVYLARYLRGGPIGNSRLRALDGERVTFGYRDFRHDGAESAMTLSVEEFTSRWLQHVPLPGQRIIRCYGLYHHALRAQLAICRYQIFVSDPSSQAASAEPSVEPPKRCCPECGAPLVSMGRIPWNQLSSLVVEGSAPPAAGRSP